MMHIRLFMYLALHGGLYHVVLGNRIGAPEEACGHLSTRHKIPPQDESKNPIPYKIYLTPDHIKPGGYVTIILRGTRPFKGFLIQVRFGDKAIGRFDNHPRDITKLLCPDETSVTHTNSGPKEELRFRWAAPADAKTGIYEVHYSVAETKDLSWADARESFWVFNPEDSGVALPSSFQLTKLLMVLFAVMLMLT